MTNLITRHIRNLEILIAGRMNRNMDAIAYIDCRDDLEVFQGQWNKMVRGLDYEQGTL